PLRAVLLIQPATALQRYGADLVVLRLNTKHLPVSAGVITDSANVVSLQHWRHGSEIMGRLGTNSDIIAIGHVPFLGGSQAPRNRWNSASEGKHDVLAQIGQVLLLPGAKAFTQSDQQQQRPNTPGDTEYGQKRA